LDDGSVFITPKKEVYIKKLLILKRTKKNSSDICKTKGEAILPICPLYIIIFIVESIFLIG